MINPDRYKGGPNRHGISVRSNPLFSQLSRVIYGTWRLNEADPNSFTPQKIHARIIKCISVGITSFDLADIYGGGNHECEKIFGDGLAIEPKLRSAITLISKCGIQFPNPSDPSIQVKHYNTSKEFILKRVNESLKNIQTSYLDVLLIHRPDMLMDAEDVADAFVELHKQGKVKYFGVSNFTTSQVSLLQSRLPMPLLVNQIEISPMCVTPFTDGSLDQMQELNILPMAWSPLGGGSIFKEGPVKSALEKVGKSVNATVDQVAIAFLLAHPTCIFPILGTNQEERIESAANALKIKLTTQQWFMIYEAAIGKNVP
jgi:predicted oxidoreductase